MDTLCNQGPPLDESTLIAEARKGDQDAFKELVKRHESRVAATVIGMLGSGPEAEDVGQETFLRLYRSLSKFRGESGLGTYLTRIAINLSLNALKRRRRRRGLFHSDSEERVANAPDHRTAGNPREARALVQWGLQRLDPRYRTVLVLRLIDGYSTRETAEILNLPQGTVLSRLARAQERLKAVLAPVYYDKRLDSKG